MSDLVRMSKFLSLVLRHKPEKIDIELDHNGWANIKELVSKFAIKNPNMTEEVLLQIVAQDEKKRYSISEDGERIRANQGHSIDVDVGFEKRSPPSILYHGTATRFLESINQQGLIKGSRQYVHLSDNRNTAITVGRRHGSPAILRIDAERMAQIGYEFFISENGVWLTEKVPPEFFVVE